MYFIGLYAFSLFTFPILLGPDWLNYIKYVNRLMWYFGWVSPIKNHKQESWRRKGNEVKIFSLLLSVLEGGNFRWAVFVPQQPSIFLSGSPTLHNCLTIADPFTLGMVTVLPTIFQWCSLWFITFVICCIINYLWIMLTKMRCLFLMGNSTNKYWGKKAIKDNDNCKSWFLWEINVKRHSNNLPTIIPIA